MIEDPRVGTVLGERYRIDALLGEGGMGRVYAAEHVLMRKRLAIKVLHRELSTVAEVVARFEREAMAAAHIDHPNVAAATDFGKLADGSIFLVLEYVEGRNLRDEIAAGPMPVERALHIGRQVATALGSAHELRIVHRDLKPENVMLVEKGGDPDFVKVLDFGIAKVPIGRTAAGDSERPITRAGMVFGTPEYMAPEQALGESVDGRADLYALGVMVYEMLAGVRPFTSRSQVGILGQQLANPPPAFRERAPGVAVPPQVELVVMRLLAKEASRRFATAADVVAAFDELLVPSPSMAHHVFTRVGGSGPLGSDVRRGATSGAGVEPRAPEPPVISEAPGTSAPVHVPRLDPIGRLNALLADSGEGAAFGAGGYSRGGAWRRGVLSFVDARRASLPPPMREALQRVPTPALLAVVGVLSLCFAIGLAALVRATVSRPDAAAPARGAGSGSVASATPASVKGPRVSIAAPSSAELARARSEGAGALQALTRRFPKHAESFVSLAQALLAERRHLEATRAVSKALELDPKLERSGKVASVLFQTAQASASGDAAFALLQGPMGARGAGIIFDLAQAKGVRASVKKRAVLWLESPAFATAASPALQVAAGLALAKTCAAKRKLLPRAAESGDDRALLQLEPLLATTGCGRDEKADCWPCLRGGTELADALAAVRRRTANR